MIEKHYKPLTRICMFDSSVNCPFIQGEWHITSYSDGPFSDDAANLLVFFSPQRKQKPSFSQAMFFPPKKVATEEKSALWFCPGSNIHTQHFESKPLEESWGRILCYSSDTVIPHLYCGLLPGKLTWAVFTEATVGVCALCLPAYLLTH